MTIGQCTICIKPESIYIANKVATKKLSHEQAAIELDVKLPDWVSHYELHVRDKLITAIAQDIEPIKKNLLDKIQEGTASIERVIKVTKSIALQLENKDNHTNYKLIQAWSGLEKNLIGGLKELAILEGDINVASKHIHYHNELRIDTIMAVVMEDAPEDFKRILLKKLDNLPQGPQPGIIVAD